MYQHGIQLHYSKAARLAVELTARHAVGLTARLAVELTARRALGLPARLAV